MNDDQGRIISVYCGVDGALGRGCFILHRLWLGLRYILGWLGLLFEDGLEFVESFDHGIYKKCGLLVLLHFGKVKVNLSSVLSVR